jgi:hypothetical protein
MVATMIRTRVPLVDEQAIETMIALAHCPKQQRILLAGANSAEHVFALHRRGYRRVATTGSCGLPSGQFNVALVDWRERSIKSLDAALDWLVEFVTPTGGLVFWVDPQPPAGNRSLRAALERHGLMVEAGTALESGSAVAARRREGRPASRAA